MPKRERLLDLLVEHSYQYAKEPQFLLASGRKSRFYINCKRTTMRRDAADLIAHVFESYIPTSARAAGGLTAGADPIAYALRDSLPLDAFMVRKQAKGHGLGNRIEGPVSPGMNVVVVDDVVTSGGSTIAAVEACKADSLNVVAVILLVDREEDGGIQKIASAVGSSVPVRAIFKRSELHNRWKELQEDGNASTVRPSAALG